MKEHDPIVLTNDIANTDLRAGDVGTVVHTYENGTAYEVEFLTLDGHTHAVETIEARSLRAVRSESGRVSPLARNGGMNCPRKRPHPPLRNRCQSLTDTQM